jgi:16S rRNA (cytidine1402-2'-O)-methyltransferase
MSSATPGTLYIVSTPIGNDEDLSSRAIRILKSVHLIAAEDPRVTKLLLDRCGVDTPVTSYPAPDLEEKVGILVSRLLDGERIALVCDAGTPIISDPGARLVEQTIAAQIPVVPIPGVSAAIAALPVSGFRDKTFFFQGHLPRSKAARQQLLHRLRRQPGTLVFFLDGSGLTATLQEIVSVLGDRRVVLAENLTKANERFVRGRPDHVLHELASTPVKGEMTLLVEGWSGERSKAGRTRRRR